MREQSATLLLFCLIFVGSALARSSDQCRGGCIIASVLFPRQCICVVPQCSTNRIQALQSNAATGSSRKRPRRRPPQAEGVDCSFCDRDAFTYRSSQECMAADTNFRPKGPSIDASVYPSLAHASAAVDAVSALSVVAQATCPPTTAAGCQDLSAFTKWESLFSAATNATDVTIPAGSQVLLHGCSQLTSTVSVKSITVPAGATLVIGDSHLTLNLQNLVVSGTFQMGTANCPIQSQISVSIPGGDESFGIDVLPGATYDVHGYTQGLTWTRVSATVLPGSSTIKLLDKVQWSVGDQILLISTTWKDEITNQNEVLTIAAISSDGLTLTTQEKIQFSHYGGEYKAEVGVLSRRILFTSDLQSKITSTGPHTTLKSGDCRITGAAFDSWGAVNRAGRYPIHFHMVGDAPQAYLKSNVVINSNWRCISIHGTNAVTVVGNIGFNVHGHCYYLEDGVEEGNEFVGNLAAYVHPINMAGSGGGQQGTDRWSGPDLFDPSDSGAAGFYSLNANNVWRYNAASGGFAGFTFPNAPRAIKDHKNMKRADGYPFVPSERPFAGFTGNTVHSTGWAWEHAGCFYFGGMLFYKTDPADGQEKLFYNNGRGQIQADPLCPDPNWPAGGEGDAWQDCYVGSSRRTKNLNGTADAFLVLEDSLAALCNVGVTTWGERIDVRGLQGYDVNRGAEYLGQSYMTDSYFKINTNNVAQGYVAWPYEGTTWWESYPIKGFEWYDTMTTTILTNVTFDNYKYKQYINDPTNWWYYQTPFAFRMLSLSDQFKPDKTMMVTKGITCKNCDLGTCTGAVCTGGALFRVDQTYRGSSWLHNWLDADGSVIRHVAPAKPPGPYLITSQPDWWKLDNSDSWKEPQFGNTWISPMPVTEVAARIEARVENSDGDRYTLGAFHGSYSDSQQGQRIGYVSQFGDVSKYVIMTRIEGTTGMTGPYGWYTVWNMSTSAYHAPKRLELILFNVPRNKAVLWASCWPAGTSFTVEKVFDGGASCQTPPPLTSVDSRQALLAGAGNTYYVDNNNCLHLKLTDPGQPWLYTDSFERDGLYIEEEVRWHNLRYVVTATGPGMSCSDAHFCPLPGNPADRVPAVISSLTRSCIDKQPPGTNCPSINCNWADSYHVNSAPSACSNADIIAGGFCQASCGTCPVLPIPKTLSVNVTLSSSLTTNTRFKVCTATVRVGDTTTGKLMPAGLTIRGVWSKVSRTKTPKTWPYNASAQTVQVGSRIRALLRSSNLPKAAGTSCTFKVTGVTGTAGYAIDSARSKRQATVRW